MSQGVALSTAPKRRGRRHPGVEKVGPGTDVGSYVVEAALGAGGFGTVFRARRGGQLYALKLLSLSEVGPSAIREVLALSSVRHPNVVGLHGFWQWPDEQPRYLRAPRPHWRLCRRLPRRHRRWLHRPRPPWCPWPPSPSLSRWLNSPPRGPTRPKPVQCLSPRSPPPSRGQVSPHL